MAADEKKPESKVPPLTEIQGQVERVESVVTDRRISESRANLSETEVTAVPVETIPIGSPLPCGLYIRVAGKLVLFRNSGDRLTPRRALALSEKGVQTLYIPVEAWQVLLESLEKMKLPEPITPESSSYYLRNLIIAFGMELQRRIKEPKKPLFDKLQALCNSLAEFIYANPSIGGKLLRKHDDELSLHSTTHGVNVAIYAAVIGHKLGFSLPELGQLIYASLLHDLGISPCPSRFF